MKTSGVFTCHSVTIPIRWNKPFYLIPFGDVHRDSSLCAVDRWKETLDGFRRRKDCYYLGMGDYTDLASTSERMIMGCGGLHESTQASIERLCEGNLALLAKELGFMRGNLIGLINGNHFYSFPDGTNGDQRLCNKLGAKYLGVCALIRLVMTDGSHSRGVTLDIVAHHGKGASRLVGGTVNTVSQMAEHFLADIHLMGHDHGRGVMPMRPMLYAQMGKKGLAVKEKQRWVGRTGSFLKAYEDGQASYNVDAGRAPSSLGHIEFEITPRRERAGDEDRLSVTIRGIS